MHKEFHLAANVCISNSTYGRWMFMGGQNIQKEVTENKFTLWYCDRNKKERIGSITPKCAERRVEKYQTERKLDQLC